MVTAVMLAAERPWTYWLAPILLVAQLLLLLMLFLRLYRKILVPSFAWMYDEEPERHAEMMQAQAATLRRPVAPPAPETPTLKAA